MAPHDGTTTGIQARAGEVTILVAAAVDGVGTTVSVAALHAVHPADLLAVELGGAAVVLLGAAVVLLGAAVVLLGGVDAAAAPARGGAAPAARSVGAWPGVPAGRPGAGPYQRLERQPAAGGRTPAIRSSSARSSRPRCSWSPPAATATPATASTPPPGRRQAAR
ncbi:hypothetical protein [Frankia tisae]|uniref:hypothetical protein n=1 Tax=Frankia tisae TaxID=2950104 RepID=UPI0021BE46CA|nr:hypothetical protein [Frankia tisae]